MMTPEDIERWARKAIAETQAEHAQIARWLDDQPMDFAEAHIKLIDALRDYLRANDELTAGLLLEGQITEEQAEQWQGERLVFVRMRERLEAVHVGTSFDL